MLTVLMPTYNGAKTLPAVLDSYCNLNSPDGGWKLVIVDNGSTDGTKEILASFKSRLPTTSIFEPRLGKSIALNAGLLHIEGDLVVMTDDDALPNPDWLIQMRLAADSQPAYSIFGGAIVPHWESPPESWILPFSSALTVTDPAWEEGPTVVARISGPNMAVRTKVFEAGFRFDPAIGPVGARYLMGEDIDFMQRLGKAGFRAWYSKRAVVAHMIRKHQMNKKWMLRRATALGRSHYEWEHAEYAPSPPTLLLGVPRYMIREILNQAFRVARAKLSQDSDTVFKERWQFHYLVGRAKGAELCLKAPG
jgi:L-malate glycosyltransferase